MVAVGPSIVVTAVMFLVRPVGGHKQVRPSDHSSFLFTSGICIVQLICWQFCFFSLSSVNENVISQSLGYANTHVFVSMISIWNFLGRVAGGYFSENIVKYYAYPRPVAMAAVQDSAMEHTGLLYQLQSQNSLDTESFGACITSLRPASPAGSLIFSGVIASGIYDYQAKQQHEHRVQGSGPGRGLDGTFSVLEVVKVYVAHEKKIYGEVDIYGILSVEPSADDETIRKHYRRLALALHPDKNKSVGADGRLDFIGSMEFVQVPETQPTLIFSLPQWLPSHQKLRPSGHVAIYARYDAPVKDQASFPWPSPLKQQGTKYPAANGSSASGVKLSATSNSVQTGYSGFGSTVRANIQQDQVFKTRDANGAQPYATTTRQAAHPGQPTGGNSKRAHAEAAVSALNREAFMKKSNLFMKTDAGTKGFVPDSVSTCSKADRLIRQHS
ncbi:hypothetical protein HAX54_003511 [Datura stramonium]|uniref:J domain-containing protein n=1 Tax=Datura stramonium TaxID=4076 RepID=A0ABS8RTE5_DATST|nr:hypothetical protein [Datura stramonium]